MLIKGATLKEKKIRVDVFMPMPKMHIKINRVNSMPDVVISNAEFNCVLEYSVIIKDKKNTSLVETKVSFLILAILDENESYEQKQIADRIFRALEPMFLKAVNDMLRETSFPPLPLNVKV